MKKILLSLAFAAFAFAANAQLVVSANIGGTMTSGNIQVKSHVTEPVDSTAGPNITPLDKETSFTGGLKIGYKFGRCQVGISGAYNMYTTTTVNLDPNLVPVMPTAAGMVTTGTVITKGNSYTIAPYFRYDIIQTGDVSIFAELSGCYTKMNDPVVNATLHYSSTVPTRPIEMDTVITSPHPLNSTTIAVRVTPGLSWQLSKHCGIDLYLDFLSLAYAKTNTQRIDPKYSFDYATLKVTTEQTEVTTEESRFGGALTGTPLLTELGENNWVRVGFNFIF